MFTCLHSTKLYPSSLQFHYLFFLASGDKCVEVDTIELLGTDIIVPGDVGIFRCKTMDSPQLFWSVNGTELFGFDALAVTGAEAQSFASKAELVDVNIADNFLGNRTSFLMYTSDPNFTGYVNITCDGGRVNTDCVHSLNIKGK